MDKPVFKLDKFITQVVGYLVGTGVAWLLVTAPWLEPFVTPDLTSTIVVVAASGIGAGINWLISLVKQFFKK